MALLFLFLFSLSLHSSLYATEKKRSFENGGTEQWSYPKHPYLKPALKASVSNKKPSYAHQLREYFNNLKTQDIPSSKASLKLEKSIFFTKRWMEDIHAREGATIKGRFNDFLEKLYRNDTKKLQEKIYDETIVNNAIYGVRSFMTFVIYTRINNDVSSSMEMLNDFFERVRSSPTYSVGSQNFMKWEEILGTYPTRSYPLDKTAFSYFFEDPLAHEPPTPWGQADFSRLLIDISHIKYTNLTLPAMEIEPQKQNLNRILSEYAPERTGFIRDQHAYEQSYTMLATILKILNQHDKLSKNDMDGILYNTQLSVRLYERMKRLTEKTLNVLPHDSLFEASYTDSREILPKRFIVFKDFNELSAIHEKNVSVLSLFRQMMERVDANTPVQDQKLVVEFINRLPHIFGKDKNLGKLMLKNLQNKIEALKYTSYKNESWITMYS